MSRAKGGILRFLVAVAPRNDKFKGFIILNLHEISIMTLKSLYHKKINKSNILGYLRQMLK
jgi:hypothetical protein